MFLVSQSCKKSDNLVILLYILQGGVPQVDFAAGTAQRVDEEAVDGEAALHQGAPKGNQLQQGSVSEGDVCRKMGIDQLGTESRVVKRKGLKALAKEAFRCNRSASIHSLGISC